MKSEISDLSLVHLRLINAILKCGNATLAAHELDLTLPGVSYHMKKIRHIFNDEMFIRTREGLKPTEKCLSIKEIVQDIIIRVEDDLFNSTSFAPENIDKEIWITVGNSSYNWIPTLIKEAQERSPRMTICARNWSMNSFSDILSGSMLCGIYTDQSCSNSLHKINLGPCKRYLFLRKGHPLTKEGALTIEKLIDYPFVLHDQCGFNSYGQSVVEKVMREKNGDFKFKAKVSNAYEIAMLLKTTNTIVYTGAQTFPLEMLETTLDVLTPPSEFEKHEYEFDFNLYVSPTKYGSLESDWIVSFIAESFRNHTENMHQSIFSYLK